MLQALDEQDLIQKRIKFFTKPSETDSSEVLYELASYLEGIGFILKQKKFTKKSLQNFQKWIWI